MDPDHQNENVSSTLKYIEIAAPSIDKLIFVTLFKVEFMRQKLYVI